MTEGAYRVFWTRTAQQDLKRIIEFIATDSDAQARRIYRTIKDKAGNLWQMPLQGRVVPELEYFQILNYRELIASPWRIIYKIEGNKVLVLAVIDARRNVEDVLLDRFI